MPSHDKPSLRARLSDRWNIVAERQQAFDLIFQRPWDAPERKPGHYTSKEVSNIVFSRSVIHALSERLEDRAIAAVKKLEEDGTRKHQVNILKTTASSPLFFMDCIEELIREDEDAIMEKRKQDPGYGVLMDEAKTAMAAKELNDLITTVREKSVKYRVLANSINATRRLEDGQEREYHSWSKLWDQKDEAKRRANWASLIAERAENFVQKRPFETDEDLCRQVADEKLDKMLRIEAAWQLHGRLSLEELSELAAEKEDPTDLTPQVPYPPPSLVPEGTFKAGLLLSPKLARTGQERLQEHVNDITNTSAPRDARIRAVPSFVEQIFWDRHPIAVNLHTALARPKPKDLKTAVWTAKQKKKKTLWGIYAAVTFGILTVLPPLAEKRKAERAEAKAFKEAGDARLERCKVMVQECTELWHQMYLEQLAAEEKAAEEKAAEEKAAEEKAAEEKAADEKTADEKTADEKAAEEKTAEDKAAEEKAAEETKA